MSAAVVWIAQSASGLADGSSAANARAVSFFNTAGNWGAGGAQIGAGTVVRFTGTITGGTVTVPTFNEAHSNSLQPQGSGTSGNPIVLDGTSATFSASIMSSARSWITIKNLTYVNDFTGDLVWISGGSNVVIDNVRADNFRGGNGVFLRQPAGNRPNNITIRNCFIRTTTANLDNTQHDLIKGEGATNILIEGCHLEQRTLGAGNEAHNDCIQCFTSGSSGSSENSNWTVRYCKLVMNSGAPADRQLLIWEGMSGTNYVYNNLFLGIQGAEGSNGIVINQGFGSAVFNFFGNTIVAKGSTLQNLFNCQAGGVMNLRGNVIYLGGSQTIFRSSDVLTTNQSYNLWRGRSFAGTGNLNNTEPQFVDFANNDFRLLATSPARGACANLGAPYDRYITGPSSPVFPGPLTAPRGTGAVWTMGAFGAGVTPPSGLNVG